MRQNVIFYFIGTGNSLKATMDIAKELGDCDVFSCRAFVNRLILERRGRVAKIGIAEAFKNFFLNGIRQ